MYHAVFVSILAMYEHGFPPYSVLPAGVYGILLSVLQRPMTTCRAESAATADCRVQILLIQHQQKLFLSRSKRAYLDLNHIWGLDLLNNQLSHPITFID
jgi:hypothetical protein